MKTRSLINALLPVALALALTACAGETAPAPTPAVGTAAPGVATDGRPQLIVHKTPWCGCCEVWANQAEAAGFAVVMHDHDDLAPIKQALGVPRSQLSCHTAEIDGYFVEGHVPFEDIRRLLAERPDAAGIAVPGMPLGSPGMEADIRQAYSTHLVGRDGQISEYARHNEDAAGAAARASHAH